MNGKVSTKAAAIGLITALLACDADMVVPDATPGGVALSLQPAVESNEDGAFFRMIRPEEYGAMGIDASDFRTLARTEGHVLGSPPLLMFGFSECDPETAIIPCDPPPPPPPAPGPEYEVGSVASYQGVFDGLHRAVLYAFTEAVAHVDAIYLDARFRRKWEPQGCSQPAHPSFWADIDHVFKSASGSPAIVEASRVFEWTGSSMSLFTTSGHGINPTHYSEFSVFTDDPICVDV